MINLLWSVLGLIGALSVLVVVHEFGHYIAARAFGIHVQKFFLFFDWPRKLWSRRIGQTEYGIGVLPFGGYVKLKGMVDESMDTQGLEAPPQPDEYRAKPVWQRIIVTLGGIIMNVLLAIVIFWVIKYTQGQVRMPMSGLKEGIFVPEKSIGYDLGLRTGDEVVSLSGKPLQYVPEPEDLEELLLGNDGYLEVRRADSTLRLPVPNGYLDQMLKSRDRAPIIFQPQVGTTIQIRPEGPAATAGLRDGDRVLQVNGTGVSRFDSLAAGIRTAQGKPITLMLQRADSTFTQTLTPGPDGLIGIQADLPPIERISYGFFGSFGPAMDLAYSTLRNQIRGFGKLFSGELGVRQGLSGPIGMAGVYGSAIQGSGWLGFWMLTAILSLVLAFMNLLPIPALDGGHLVFEIIEGITRRRPSLKVRMMAQQMGMLLLLGLMVFVMFNDLAKLF